MSTIYKVTISLDVGERGATELCDMLSPDNVDFPEGMAVEMRTADETIIMDIYSDRSLAQVTGTVDEILSHAQMALDVAGQGGMAR